MQITVRIAPFAAAVASALLTLSYGAWPGTGTLLASPLARAAPRRVATGGALHYGKSVGSPTVGRLIGGMHLDETPYVRIVPTYAGGDVRWGLEPLIDAIDRAARSVRRQFPDAVTSVGHISRAGGGEIDRHHSHESGRDADIAFFVKSSANKPMLANHFIVFKGDGSSSQWRGAYFDDVRNWALVQALLTDPEAHVSHIFVANPLRARLLTVAERLNAPLAIRSRAAELLQQPRGALPHDDHFHVRISCPARMTSCIENPTVRTLVATTRDTPHGHPRLALLTHGGPTNPHHAKARASKTATHGVAPTHPTAPAHGPHVAETPRSLSTHDADGLHDDEPNEDDTPSLMSPVPALPDLQLSPPPTSSIEVEDPDGLGAE